jgi:hypothetical protein
MNATDIIDKLIEESGTKSRLSVVKMGKAFQFLGFIKTQKYNGKYQVKGYYVKPIDHTAEVEQPSDVLRAPDVPF